MQYSGLIALLIFLVVLVIFLRHEAKCENEEEVEETIQETVKTSASPLNINDEDALVASLVASIELRNETHKNVQVISVREVK